MSEQLCSVLVTVSVKDSLIELIIRKNVKYHNFLSRGEGHGDTVLFTGHKMSVTEVAAGVCRPLVLRAVEAVPVFSLTSTKIYMRGERRSILQFELLFTKMDN